MNSRGEDIALDQILCEMEENPDRCLGYQFIFGARTRAKGARGKGSREADLVIIDTRRDLLHFIEIKSGRTVYNGKEWTSFRKINPYDQVASATKKTVKELTSHLFEIHGQEKSKWRFYHYRYVWLSTTTREHCGAKNLSKVQQSFLITKGENLLDRIEEALSGRNFASRNRLKDLQNHVDDMLGYWNANTLPELSQLGDLTTIKASFQEKRAALSPCQDQPSIDHERPPVAKKQPPRFTMESINHLFRSGKNREAGPGNTQRLFKALLLIAVIAVPVTIIFTKTEDTVVTDSRDALAAFSSSIQKASNLRALDAAIALGPGEKVSWSNSEIGVKGTVMLISATPGSPCFRLLIDTAGANQQWQASYIEACRRSSGWKIKRSPVQN